MSAHRPGPPASTGSAHTIDFSQAASPVLSHGSIIAPGNLNIESFQAKPRHALLSGHKQQPAACQAMDSMRAHLSAGLQEAVEEGVRVPKVEGHKVLREAIRHQLLLSLIHI